ncbi:hypothetical protein HBH64_150560 [Parastagonospora nodorum]|nr:hypothetical protein HBH49_083740 [Parastagonospora nodorum]KAH4115822.1 hypothetical protein HBH47_177120 [Parastagonospora nodorum]KAH4220499.1 hypothetical protein HBI06_171380 [Parastagonospora nodorum]KAH4276600.1 hypothetical protein HBI04_110860 [Parastagonospora nodorum]KAH4393725.1 hypothetical protein HBH97_032570 [Parastagonospora nodorum]
MLRHPRNLQHARCASWSKLPRLTGLCLAASIPPVPGDILRDGGGACAPSSFYHECRISLCMTFYLNGGYCSVEAGCLVVLDAYQVPRQH